MWIRSQNKYVLANVEMLEIRDGFISTIDKRGTSRPLGLYTQERALEVLNDIQKDIETCTHTEHYDYRYQDSEHFLDTKRISQTVFQMPEK